ncbi:hypothetical protein ACRE_075880 [Hapsidospora chrysogenum ATCC 11550]|uniref:Uncharacterized protein n=1 Tax=Hapsidospora chrysogenum (strain ATCC 11550 / CBS 779.69 / DSM 880 / IAM 14645 / JCM 23072 / IMI 49137) TaxID=857340 RepID=A0A086SX68_HAPC1|nr:hypothetical protein ACRE_075880 [Hapsidospora chrysogenum ATCC 11550]
MKFFLPLAALAAGVAAQSTSAPTARPSSGSDDCLADYILNRCLETEMPKAEACDINDYECQCAAYEAIATCFNNCPDDTRAAAVRTQVTAYCSQVQSTGTPSSTMATTTSRATLSDTSTSAEERPSNTDSFIASDRPRETDAAGMLAGNAGGVILGFAGVVAAIL